MKLIDSALKIRVFARNGSVSAVEIVSPRVDVSRVFIGRATEEAYALAASLFTLCPAAQSLAAQAAGEAAMGRKPDVYQHRTRILRLLCERLGEMLRASLLDWPQDSLQAGAPDAEVFACLREILAALRALPEQGEAASGLYERVRQAALRLGLKDYSRGGGFFARQWADVAADEKAWSLSPLAVDGFRAEDDDAVARAMIEPAFSRAPALPGRCMETGAAARRQGNSGSALANDLAGRLAARFADMASALDMIGLLLAGETPPLGALVAKTLAPGEGFAAVESARGRLFHRIRLDGAGRIADYRVVAPTEWNFHPDGPFVGLLRGARIGEGEAALRRLQRLAFVFDPCLRVGVELREVELPENADA
jgi:coenzyme F420-reducing hydrogenase alpha subunit